MSNIVWMRVYETTPGVFAQPENGLGMASAVQPNMSLVSQLNPAIAGETIYLDTTGLGTVNASPGITGVFGTSTHIPAYPITATIGGQNAIVTYPKLLPLTAGLYQIAVTVPAGVTGDVPLVISGPDAVTMQTTIQVAASSASASANQKPAVPEAGNPFP